jgi:hypothetical protein
MQQMLAKTGEKVGGFRAALIQTPSAVSAFPSQESVTCGVGSGIGIVVRQENAV